MQIFKEFSFDQKKALNDSVLESTLSIPRAILHCTVRYVNTVSCNCYMKS